MSESTVHLNNTTTIRGSVASVRLFFPSTESSLFYEPGTYTYENGLSYVGQRRATAHTPFRVVSAVAYAIEKLFEVNRLDLVMSLIDYPEFRDLGIEVEAEFRVSGTGHGDITGQAVLLVKN